MKTRFQALSRIAAMVAALAAAGGCTYQSVALSTAEPVEDIAVDQTRDIRIDYFIDVADDFQAVESRRIGHMCVAHKYPLNVVPAVTETIDEVLRNAFSDPQRHEMPVMMPAAGNQYFIEFRVESFETVLGYSSGTWSGSAHADAAMNMSVSIVGPDGIEVHRSSLSGDGSAIQAGGCAQGAVALSESASEAIEETVQAFVYKVVNSRLLDTLEENSAAAAETGMP